MSVSTPVKAYVATIMAGTQVSGGTSAASVTATYDATGAWEIQVPVTIVYGLTSADALVKVYRSMDQGAVQFDTIPMMQFNIARTASATVRQSISLSTGLYAMQVTANISSNAAITAQFLTTLVVTSIQIV